MIQVLNLAYPEKSDIKFKVIKFPDGQQNIVVDLSTINSDTCVVASRFCNFTDYELMVLAGYAIMDKVEKIKYYIPYMLGARSDRQFEEGSVVYTDFIETMLYALAGESCTALDIHNPKAFTTDWVKNQSPKSFITDVRFDIACNRIANILKYKSTIFVSPDKGAKERLKGLLPKKATIIQCDKERNLKTGEIIKTVVPLKDIKTKDAAFIIVDDICDGGKTFIEIAKELPEENEKFLVVTHGIFSKGIEPLAKYFKRIYCTNSYKDVAHPIIKQYDIYDNEQIRTATL